jgi:hypothetical protein
MTKITTYFIRKWLLTASLILAAGAAKAQTYELVYIQAGYSASSLTYFDYLPPVVRTFSTSTACTTAAGNLQRDSGTFWPAYATWLGIGGTVTGVGFGACYQVGPTAFNTPGAEARITVLGGTKGLLDVRIPTDTVAHCTANLANFQAALSPVIPTISNTTYFVSAACITE